ncbi:MAG TPA: proton-conducting transporter membrane subunit [Streptosporangiaceae bacterium]|nr:proton-conducting transporter membrane subunit [Streptosporangiaceae bacterium]
MITALTGAAVGGIAAGAALSLVRHQQRRGLALQAAAAALLAVVGFAVLLRGHAIGAPFTSRLQPRLGADRLSGLFLGTLGLVALPALGYASRYLGDTRRDRVVAALTGAFVLAMAALLCARDPVTFLGSWELVTLVPAVIIAVYRGADRQCRRTVFVYIAITHLGGVGTWVAILLLARAGAVGTPGAIAAGSGLQIGIAIAALIGLGAKAGLVPLHSWLPRAHPIAPAPVSALMSGIMIKLAVYAMIRVFVDWLGVLPLWFGIVVLAAGALAAVGGVTYALFQHELKRLLALHSIENVGIIVLGVGACLILRSRGEQAWAAFALAAALLHTLNHAVFKSLLFLGAGSVERAAGSLRLDQLGGLLRRMPWTGAAFGIGAMAIAGLPPLNGFASEWLTLQALVHLPMSGGVSSGVSGVIALGALGATAALAVLCFVKVTGLVLLGPARTAAAREACEAPGAMRAAVLLLAAACVVLGAAPGLLLPGLTAVVPWHTAVHYQPGLHLPGTGSLRPVAIALLLVAGTAALARLRGRRVAAPAPTWACGQQVGPELNWSSAGFTKPLRLMLEGVLRPRREIDVRASGGITTAIRYHGEVPNLIDERIYRPVSRWSLAAAAQARRIQTGSLGVYAGYLIVLVVALLLAARIGLLS